MSRTGPALPIQQPRGFLTGPWIFKDVCLLHTAMIQAHVAEALSSYFDGRPMTHRLAENMGAFLQMLTEGYHDRHFDYRVSPSAGGEIRVLRRHVDLPCPFHTLFAAWEDISDKVFFGEVQAPEQKDGVA